MKQPSTDHEWPLFLRGIELFNQGKYFECHEVLEELWRTELEPDRQFTQGLIQIAVAMHHLTAGNRTGARKLLTRGIARLQKFPPVHRGIDSAGLIGSSEQLLAHLEETNLFTPPIIGLR